MDTSVEMMPDSKLKAQKVNVFYAEKQALYDVTLGIEEKSVTSLSDRQVAASQLFYVVSTG